MIDLTSAVIGPNLLSCKPDPLSGQLERACRFERLCYRALAEGLISLSKAAELLRLSVPAVEAGLKGPQKADADRRQ